MSKNRIAVISASLGGFDAVAAHVMQSLEYDYHVFTDDNFPPRDKAMTSRLQAKIPKCFGWQMAPGYDYYLWLDGSLVLTSPDAVKYFYDQVQDYDMVMFKHPRRNTVKWEGRYLQRGLRQGSRYLVDRYKNELLEEQMVEIAGDAGFVDDLLVSGGVFMYKNTLGVQQMLKQWWYHISRYLVMDQCSLAYVLKQSRLKINVRPDNVYVDCPYVRHCGHARHA